VVVVIGVGGMGEAIARRQGSGRKLILADFNEQTLESLTSSLQSDGYDVAAHRVDVGSRESVAALAQDAGAGVVIASMSGHMIPDVPPDQQKDLATAPVDELLTLPAVQEVTHPGLAYALAKQANRFRVRAESINWGRRGARLNSISPGIISTPQGRFELDSEHGEHMRAWIDASGTHRVGTPFDIANAVAFLLSRESSFITGTDLLVDGGVVGAIKAGALGRRVGRGS
jgi:NAD(P)-dependent dehydrogenase (short-subunit alcohol dehydrogenase family)